MKVDLLVKNGKVVTPSAIVEAAVAIKDGKIAALLEGNSPLPEAAEIYDARGKYVLPGLIDGHVHFREPGFDYKEDFATGSLAAAFGGITSVVDMPNVKPPIATVEVLKQKIAAGRARSYVDFAAYGVILQDNLSQLLPLAQAGVVGYKIFLGSTVGNIPSPDDGMMLEAMKAVAATGLRIGFHAENNDIVRHETEKLQEAGITEARRYPESRPNVAEADAIRKVIAFAEYSGAKVHIYHMSSKEGVELVRSAKKRGLDITAETCPHYLLTDAEYYDALGVKLKINPPVRYKEDQERLWEGLLDGTVDIIATDHSPHTREEKAGNIWEAAAGFCGVETGVPLLLTQVNKGRLTLEQYVKLAAENPARIWNMYPRKGALLPGSDGDITIVDMEREAVIQEDRLHSKNKITPFDGWKVKGMPIATIVRGKFVVKDGQGLGDPHWGQLITPAP